MTTIAVYSVIPLPDWVQSLGVFGLLPIRKYIHFIAYAGMAGVFTYALLDSKRPDWVICAVGVRAHGFVRHRNGVRTARAGTSPLQSGGYVTECGRDRRRRELATPPRLGTVVSGRGASERGRGNWIDAGGRRLGPPGLAGNIGIGVGVQETNDRGFELSD